MKKQWFSFWLFIVALLCALFAQRLLSQPVLVEISVALFAVAIMLFFAGLLFGVPVQLNSADATEGVDSRGSLDGFWWVQCVALAGIAMLMGYAYQRFAGNEFTRAGMLAWVLAILLYIWAFGRMPAQWLVQQWQNWQKGEWQIRIQKHHLLLLTIFLVALFFRAYRLAEIPSDMGSDQAEKLLDVQDVFGGLRPIFFPRNTGREAGQFYLTAFLIRYTPLELNHLALKVGTVLVSLMAIPFTYLLGKELYGRSAGMLAAFFLAISHWHIAISRVGLRFPFTAAFATPTLFFLFRALRHNRRNDWLATGLFLGVGLHTYIPMRIVPLLLVMLVLLKVAIDRFPFRIASREQSFKEYLLCWLPNGLLSAGICFLIFLPLFRYMMDDPNMFWYRVTTRSSEALGEVNSLQIFWQNVKNAALMFNYRGDVVFSNTIPFAPALGWVEGGLFILGVAYLLWQIVMRRDRRSVYLMLSLFMLVLPSILSIAFPQENPSVVRTGGAIPIAMIMVALPLALLWERAKGINVKWIQGIAGIFILSFFFLASRDNYRWYFVNYHQQFRATIWNAQQMGTVVKGFAQSVGDLSHAYHVAYPFWVDSRAIGVNAGNINWGLTNAIIQLPTVLPQHVADPRSKLYLVNIQDSSSITLLQQVYPTGILNRHYSEIARDKDFWIFFVPAQYQQGSTSLP